MQCQCTKIQKEVKGAQAYEGRSLDLHVLYVDGVLQGAVGLGRLLAEAGLA